MSSISMKQMLTQNKFPKIMPIKILFLAIIVACEQHATGDVSEETQNSISRMMESSPRIVGGKETKVHGYPSVVSFHYRGSLLCAGTIVHEEYIVSAAHCIFSLDPERYTFKAGEHNVNKNEDSEQHVEAVKLYRHPQFDTSTYRYDIVLFKISPPFKFNEAVQKVTWPDANLEPTGMTTAVGWGDTREGGSSSAVLREVELPIVPNSQCVKSYPASIFEESICAGYDQGGKDACQGDSGGPLYVKEGNKQIIVGIVSNGKGCARQNYPGVYTRFTKFINWLKEVSGVDFTNDAGDNGDNPPAKKRKISRDLADSICKQHTEYLSSQKLPTPVKERPGSEIIPGNYVWRTCQKSSCNPFKFQ